MFPWDCVGGRIIDRYEESFGDENRYILILVVDIWYIHMSKSIKPLT